jgi:hypothetical protein
MKGDEEGGERVDCVFYFFRMKDKEGEKKKDRGEKVRG